MITVIEGDHGSACFHPDTAAARAVIECQVELQARAGGNACLGRQVYPLMVAAGLRHVRVTPRMVYVDGSRPDDAKSFTSRTFIAMVADVRLSAISAGLTTAGPFDEGIRDLRRTVLRGGVFCYTFFKGVGVVRRAPRGRRSDGRSEKLG